jgi:hypothetical protein
MRKTFLICALASALTGFGGAPQFAIAAEMPPEAVRLHGALMPKVQPPVRSWIGQEARRVVMAGSQTAPDVAAIRAQVRSRFAGQRLGEMDIEALVVLVMMEAAATEQQEIRDMLAEMKKVNAEKERRRAFLAETRKEQQAVKDDLKAKYDSQNELSQMQSMRLQMLMDRRAKVVEMLSNLMKKISSTQETLVGNLK